MSKSRLPRILGTSVINEKGQLVIPADARKKLGLEAGDRMVIMAKDDSSVLMAVKARELEELSRDLAKVLENTKEK